MPEWERTSPGRQIRCPVCRRGLGIVSSARVFFVRVNPHGKDAGPTPEGDYSERCRHRDCGVNLERKVIAAA